MQISLKKTVLACAVIALSSSALADDSGLSIYGRIGTSIESIKTGKVRTNGINSSGSNFGFIGSESLGGGLKAGFQLESAFNSDDGSNASAEFFDSRSELFLESELGTLRMGRFYSPSYYAIADPVSLHNEDYGISADKLYAGVENYTNRVAYRSPDLAGLTLESSVSLHEKNPDMPNKNAYDLAATYELGNWSFGATYGKWAEAKQYALRATWSDGPWTVSAYHQRSEDWNALEYVVQPQDGKRNVSRMAVAYAIGEGDLHANFGRANGPRGESAVQWTVGYNYHLSKRTKLYAFYTAVQNKGGANYGEYGMQPGEDLKAVTMGIRHSF